MGNGTRLKSVLVYCLCAVVCGLLLSHVAADEGVLPRIVVSADGTGFVQSGTAVSFTASGFNYDHDLQGRLIEDYWHSDWALVERDFQRMKQLGA